MEQNIHKPYNSNSSGSDGIGCLIFIGIILLIGWFGSKDNSQVSENSYSSYSYSSKAQEVILPENRLPNGEWIKRDNNFFQNYYGLNTLTIDNSQGSSDAIAKLVLVGEKQAKMSVYIRQGGSYTITDIPNGEYEIYFAYVKGYNWGTNAPMGLMGTQKADETFDLRSKQKNGYIRATITLYEKYDGNLGTDYVKESEFNNL